MKYGCVHVLNKSKNIHVACFSFHIESICYPFARRLLTTWNKATSKWYPIFIQLCSESERRKEFHTLCKYCNSILLLFFFSWHFKWLRIIFPKWDCFVFFFLLSSFRSSTSINPRAPIRTIPINGKSMEICTANDLFALNSLFYCYCKRNAGPIRCNNVVKKS